MEVLTTTPFGQRPLTAALVERATRAQAPAPAATFGKWELFRALCTGRQRFGISDRDLAVLNALLSFHPGDQLRDDGALIVFPSNRALSDRAHGMAESTLRRHLAALVQAGLIARHDSPNGKRYARRSREGKIARAFGFDLRPLLEQAADILDAAETARARAEQIRSLREDISLMRRDAVKLIAYARDRGLGRGWAGLEARLDDLRARMRRKLDAPTLETLRDMLRSLLTTVHETLSPTAKMSGSASRNERHHQISDKESLESEPVQCTETADPAQPEKETAPPALPLAVVLEACPDIQPYARHGLDHWHQLVSTAGFVRGMMGIPADVWTKAQDTMGREMAAITLAGMLQRVGEIRSPGAYLRSLTRKAAQSRFSPVPMILALLDRQTAPG